MVQTTDSDGQAGFLVRTTDTSAESAAAAANKVADQFGWDTESFEVTTIGPDWGTSVIQSSCIAFFKMLLLIIAYISGASAIRKMGVPRLSPCCMTWSSCSAFMQARGSRGHAEHHRSVAHHPKLFALTIRWSFHRINENMKGDSPKCTFATMANHSVNEVLVRSLNTSITSLIPVAAMLIFGGETLRDFALAMTVGLVCGCYSSYAIATPIYVMWKTREPQFAKLQKKYGTEIQRWFLNRLPQAAPSPQLLLPDAAARCGSGWCWPGRACRVVAAFAGSAAARSLAAKPPQEEAQEAFKANKKAADSPQPETGGPFCCMICRTGP